MSQCSKRRAHLASAVHQAFTKPRGFRKRGPTMTRLIEDEELPMVHVINFQGSQVSGGSSCCFYINLGVYVVGLYRDDGVNLDRIKEYNCHLRRRIAPDKEGRGGRWRLGMNVALECKRIVEALGREGAPFFDRFESATGLVDAFETRKNTEGVGALGEHVAGIYARRGKLVRARQILEHRLHYLADRHPHANLARIHDLAQHFGVGDLPL